MLPTSVSIPFKNCWRPILQLMESAPGIDITRGMTMTDELISSYYQIGLNHVKSKASYIWEKMTSHESWSISSWSKHIKHSSIEKWGSENDKAARPPATYRNRPHATKRARVNRSIASVFNN